MDIVTFRRRVLEIQAELETLDPAAPGAAERARELGAELDELAAEQHERTTRVAARAFGQAVTTTGVDAPVDTLSSLVERLEQATTPDPAEGASYPGPVDRPDAKDSNE